VRDRRRVAQVRRDRLDRRADLALACRARARVLGVGCQRDGGEHGGIPRAEVLGRELAAAAALDVVVDVLGAQLAEATVLAVGQQLRPASPALELADHLQRLRVFDPLAVGIAVLEAAPAPAPSDARRGAARSSQARHRPTDSASA
jgi:hypothetical protein